MFEYDFYIALSEARREGRPYSFRFPLSAVVYLRGAGKDVRDSLKLDVEFPDGQAVSYSVPVFKARDVTLDEIFSEHLLMLLPFYVIRYEKELDEIERDDDRLAKFLMEYQQIAARMGDSLPEADRAETYYDLSKLIQLVAGYVLR